MGKKCLPKKFFFDFSRSSISFIIKGVCWFFVDTYVDFFGVFVGFSNFKTKTLRNLCFMKVFSILFKLAHVVYEI